MTKLLIVDDHTLFQQGLKGLLEAENLLVQTAKNGEEALAILRRDLFHVILLDIEMPGLDGIETAKQIIENWPNIKIIMLTTHDKMVMIDRVINIGVHGYLLKNAKKEDVLSAITTVRDGGMYYSPEITQKIIAQRHKEQDSNYKLTKREKEILQLIADGMTTHQISEKLSISDYTVNSHRKNLLSKSQCKNATQLIKWARENEMIV